MAEGFAEHRRMAQEQALEMARDGQQAVLEVHPHLRPVRRAAGFPATPEQALAVIGVIRRFVRTITVRTKNVLRTTWW